MKSRELCQIGLGVVVVLTISLTSAAAADVSQKLLEEYNIQDTPMTASSPRDPESTGPSHGDHQHDWPSAMSRGRVRAVVPRIAGDELVDLEVVDNTLIFDGDIEVGGYNEEQGKAFISPWALEVNALPSDHRELAAVLHKNRQHWPDGKVRGCNREHTRRNTPPIFA